MMTGWATVWGKKECQVETETEEMETPQARRNSNPVPSPPPRVEADSERWVKELTRQGNDWELLVAEMLKREAGKKS